MKNFKSIFIFAFFAMFFFNACGPTKQDAIDYNDKIIREQKKIVQAESDLVKAIKNTSIKVNTLEGLRDELSAQIDESKKVFESLDKIGGSTDFKDASLQFADAYKEVVDGEYAEWLSTLDIPDSLVTDAIIDREEELVFLINNKLDKANNEFVGAQKDFAAKFKIILADY